MVLHVKNLSVQYLKTADRLILQDISFSLEPGERVALIGANGAGKSTLLLTLMGIIPLQGGDITLGGMNPTDKEQLRRLRQAAGMVFQNPEDQLFMPTLLEDVSFGLRNYGFDEKTMEGRITDILARLGISRLTNRLSHTLSGGEKRLAALAGVLVMEPSLLLLDEPSSFLDPRSRRTLIRILDSLPQTMLVATHDLELAQELCARILLLKEGRLFADGPAQALLQDHALLEQAGL
ncbi:MAG: energy-coupling factor ABC transporter ATP-binding protein [Treponema sp.]|jgi:cobalt/nickel transport system ATP-binding protein|nr:energy-coupling factor ABC transporter ATP-binding protein [Treponema sp.]